MARKTKQSFTQQTPPKVDSETEREGEREKREREAPCGVFLGEAHTTKFVFVVSIVGAREKKNAERTDTPKHTKRVWE